MWAPTLPPKARKVTLTVWGDSSAQKKPAGRFSLLPPWNTRKVRAKMTSLDSIWFFTFGEKKILSSNCGQFTTPCSPQSNSGYVKNATHNSLVHVMGLMLENWYHGNFKINFTMSLSSTDSLFHHTPKLALRVMTNKTRTQYPGLT